MTDRKGRELTPNLSTQLAPKSTSAKNLIDTSISDALATARSKGLANLKHKLGEYEFNEPDFQQILTWADQILESPEVILEQLQGDEDDMFMEGFKVEDGSITSLTFNHHVDFQPTKDTPIKLPNLLHLNCSHQGVEHLDLSYVPKLVELNCQANKLTALNLSKVPLLEELYFGANETQSTDLSHVPKLKTLYCFENGIKELGLIGLSNLEKLDCRNNKISQIDLSHIPKLRSLVCTTNIIEHLDLSKVSRTTSCKSILP